MAIPPPSREFSMKKRTAIITGASSGIGRCFAQHLDELGSFEEVIVIARRLDRLQQLSCPCPVRPLAMDLTDRCCYEELQKLFGEEQPDIALLINCSGFGRFCATMDCDLATNLNMLDLNCGALMALCQLAVPYMSAGARIINIASVAALQPVPYINVYAATKAFVLSFSRGLGRELRGSGITVTAVCPFWTKTEFFSRAIDKDREQVVKKYAAMYTPQQIVQRAIRDAKRGRDFSCCGFVAMTQGILAKLLPHGFVMSFWMRQQKLS